MDQKLLFLINREWTSSAADRVMALASSWGFWLPITFALILVLLVKGGFTVRAFVITAALIVGFNDGVISRSLKRAINRPRPHQAVDGVRVVDLAKTKPRFLAVLRPAAVKVSHPDFSPVEGRSCPSSHTMNMFSVALTAVVFFGRRMAWTFGIAALVAYSRIYAGAHWPSDVLTSIFLAFGATLLLLAALNALWRRGARTWLPELGERHPSLFPA